MASIQFIAGVLVLACLSGMVGCRTTSRMHSDSQPARPTIDEIRAVFEQRGVQPGQPLPDARVQTLDGQATTLTEALQGRPTLLVTCSLTCNVARRQQEHVNALAKRYGRQLNVVMLYTIDAHPKGDPCPYTGDEWVPKANEVDGVLHRQPTTIDERRALAKEFIERLGVHAFVLVDEMNDAAWKALGSAPNLGLLVTADGVVKIKQGWFDGPSMTAAIEQMLTNAASAAHPGAGTS